MAKIQPGDGDHRHGTANGYTNLGCRCRPCRDAGNAYHRQGYVPHPGRVFSEEEISVALAIYLDHGTGSAAEFVGASRTTIVNWANARGVLRERKVTKVTHGLAGSQYGCRCDVCAEAMGSTPDTGARAA